MNYYSDSEETDRPEKLDGEPPLDLSALLNPDPAPGPASRPSDSATLGEMARWAHAIGLRIAEAKPQSKHLAKHHANDNGDRNTLVAVEQAWSETPDANVVLRPGYTRIWDGEDPVCIVALDADGPKADAYVRGQLTEAGILDKTPCVRHGEGAKYIMRVLGAVPSARLLVPACKNEGHDGLELLGQGKKAVAWGVHPDTGDPYRWTVSLPADLTMIPFAPSAILGLPRKASKQGGGDLSDDMVVRQSGGREWTVASLREEMNARGLDKVGNLHSPLRSDSKPSCFAVLKGDSIRIYDSAEGAWYSDGRYEGMVGGGAAHPAGSLSGTWGRRIRVQSRYLDLELHHLMQEEGARRLANLVAIRSPIGTGKTTCLKKLIAEFEEAHGRKPTVLNITYRKSLAQHLSNTLGLRCYLGINEAGWKEVEAADLEQLAIQLDSITAYEGRGKLADRLWTKREGGLPRPVKWDLVILDEAEAIFRHIHGGTLKDRSYGVWSRLAEILKTHARTVVLADALLSGYSLAAYEGLVGGRPDDSVLIENNWLRGSNTAIQTYWVTRDLEYQTQRVVTAPRLFKMPTPEDAEFWAFNGLAAGKRVYMAVTRKAEAVRLADKAIRAGYEVVKVTGDHDDPAGELLLANPDDYLAVHQPQFVVATQALESGFSIDSPYFDFEVLLGWGDSSTWQDLVQMVGRVRQPKSRAILAWVQERGRAPWQYEVPLRWALESGQEASYGLMKTFEQTPGVYVRQPRDAEHFDSYVRTVCFENRSRAALGEDFWGYWAYHNCEVTDVAEHPGTSTLGENELRAARREKREQKQRLKGEKAQRMAELDTGGLSVESARASLDSASAPPEDREKAHKVLMEDFYGRELTAEIALWDDGGKGRAKVRQFNDVRAVALGHQGLLADKDSTSAAKGVTATESRRLLRAELSWAVLEELGFGVQDIEGTTDEPTERLEDRFSQDPDELAAWLARRDVRDQFKLHLGVDPWRFGFGGCHSGSFTKKNESTVTPTTTEGGLLIDPVVDALNEEDFAAAGAAWSARRDNPAPPKVIKFLRAVLRLLGLKLSKRKQRRVEGELVGYYTIDQATAAALVDLGGVAWDRLLGVDVPDEDPEDDEVVRLADELERAAARTGGEAAEEMRRHARHLLRTRLRVDPDNLGLALAMLGREPDSSAVERRAA